MVDADAIFTDEKVHCCLGSTLS